MAEFVAGESIEPNAVGFVRTGGGRIFIVAPLTGVASTGSGETEIVFVTVERQVLYTKRGFNAMLAEYEFWQTNDPLEGPPSANTLLDITIVAQSN